MKKYQKEIIALSAGEVLLSIFDLALPFFSASSVYRVSAKKYEEERDIEKSNFTERVKYLKRRGMIKTFIEGKEKYYEITTKGLAKIDEYRIDNIKINHTSKWDGKWRLVVYDIPEKRKSSRDWLQNRLLELDFVKIQDSVYVFPFECTKEIATISSLLNISQYVLISISDIIQGEENIIEKFLEKEILTEKDLKKYNNKSRKFNQLYNF